MGTLIVLVIIVVLAGLAVRKLIHDKKNGISLQCGGNCEICISNCSALKTDLNAEKKD